MKAFKILFAGLICFCLNGCSIRYIKYQKAAKKLQNNEMSEDEFKKEFYSLYKEEGNIYPSDTTLAIKFEGRYVMEEFRASILFSTYRTLKFFPDGTVHETSRMSEYPNYYNLQSVSTSSYSYSLKNDKVEIEDVMVRAWNVENIIKTGRIRNDTISFFEVRNLSSRFSKSSIKQEYVYDETIK